MDRGTWEDYSPWGHRVKHECATKPTCACVHTHSQSGGLQLLELTFPFLRTEQINLPTG